MDLLAKVSSLTLQTPDADAIGIARDVPRARCVVLLFVFIVVVSDLENVARGVAQTGVFALERRAVG